jgi:hypothetical protein
MLLSLRLFPIDLQAFGNNLVATAVLAVGLAWHLLHPPSHDNVSALSPAAGELQQDIKSKPR